jgi:hypothetical protein
MFPAAVRGGAVARHRLGEEDPPTLASGGAIQVDPDRVTDFARSVRANVAGTIDPTAPAVRGTLTGRPFGTASPSAALGTMLAQYEQCLTNMGLQVLALQHCVQVITDAAGRISANYESSDAFAKATTFDVDAMLQDVTRTVQSPVPPARFATTPRYE